MAVTRDEIATVAELTEKECREVMAERAGLREDRINRPIRAELAVEIDALLDAWLALGNE